VGGFQVGARQGETGGLEVAIKGCHVPIMGALAEWVKRVGNALDGRTSRPKVNRNRRVQDQ
jgi:hypothetical protein